MRILGVMVLGVAFVLFALGIAEEEIFAVLLSVVTGVGGLALWDRGTRAKLMPPSPQPVPTPELELRLRRLEEQLAVTQDELALTHGEVARLVEERDFLRQLYPKVGGAGEAGNR